MTKSTRFKTKTTKKAGYAPLTGEGKIAEMVPLKVNLFV